MAVREQASRENDWVRPCERAGGVVWDVARGLVVGDGAR